MSQALFEKALHLSIQQPWLIGKSIEMKHLHSICKTDEELELILDLLARFSFVNGAELSIRLGAIACTIVEEWNLDSANTIIIAKSIEGRTDSSQAIQYMLTTSFVKYDQRGWKKKNNFQTNLRKVLSLNSLKSLVLVDDFSGTGSALSELIVWIGEEANRQLRPCPDIYACFLCAQESTRERIYPDALKKIFACEWAKKGISDFWGDTERDTRIKQMRQIETELNGLSPKFSLGYMQSEALYACQNFNAPNNVFPVFWYPKLKNRDGHQPLLRRLK